MSMRISIEMFRIAMNISRVTIKICKVSLNSDGHFSKFSEETIQASKFLLKKKNWLNLDWNFLYFDLNLLIIDRKSLNFYKNFGSSIS